jgi:hypothetical protein
MPHQLYTQNRFPSSTRLTVESCRDLVRAPHPVLVDQVIVHITLQQGETALTVLHITSATAAAF